MAVANTLPHELLLAIATCTFASSRTRLEDGFEPHTIQIQTLHSFSLVAQAWCHPAQNVLFQHIVVRTHERWGLLLRRLAAPSSTHLRTLIRALELRIKLDLDPSVDRLFRRSRLLPNLERIVFNGAPSFGFLRLLSWTDTEELSELNQGTKLEWGRSPLCKLTKVYACAYAPEPEVELASSECPSLALETFCIMNSLCQNSLLRWLDKTRTLYSKSLRNATCSIWASGGRRAIQDFLGKYDTIERLTLLVNVEEEGLPIRELGEHLGDGFVRMFPGLTISPSDMDLGICSATSLVLKVSLEPTRKAYPAAFSVLRYTRFPRLRTVRVEFGASTYKRGWGRPNNSGIDMERCMIPEELVKQLERIVIVIRKGYLEGNWKAVMELSLVLSAAYAKGIVRYEEGGGGDDGT
jgi:hypothetical protein